ncbi:MAG: hypothetical protein ACJ8G3_18300 [Burkholderiaceae bacterium]
MVTMRISPTEVQAGDIIYVFSDTADATEFEECVATVGVKYCELEVAAADKRYAQAGDELPDSTMSASSH